MKILIEVNGGVVTSVKTSSDKCTVTVMDWDDIPLVVYDIDKEVMSADEIKDYIRDQKEKSIDI